MGAIPEPESHCSLDSGSRQAADLIRSVLGSEARRGDDMLEHGGAFRPRNEPRLYSQSLRCGCRRRCVFLRQGVARCIA